MKSEIRATRASGSTRRRIEQALARGWQPGLSLKSILHGRRRHNDRPGYNSPANNFDRGRGGHE